MNTANPLMGDEVGWASEVGEVLTAEEVDEAFVAEEDPVGCAFAVVVTTLEGGGSFLSVFAAGLKKLNTGEGFTSC